MAQIRPEHPTPQASVAVTENPATSHSTENKQVRKTGSLETEVPRPRPHPVVKIPNTQELSNCWDIHTLTCCMLQCVCF